MDIKTLVQGIGKSLCDSKTLVQGNKMKFESKDFFYFTSLNIINEEKQVKVLLERTRVKIAFIVFLVQETQG